MRLGVVGCGLITQLAHLPALAAQSERFAVVAVADPSPRVREAVARRHGIAAAYAAHEDLLAHAGVDAVLVASPNGTHAQVTLDALDAGAHVLVEKPMCLTATDAGRIVEFAARAGPRRPGRVHEALRRGLRGAARAAARGGGAEARRLRDDRSGHRRALPAARLRGGHGRRPGNA